jgi:hypothetical protein
MNIKFQGKIIKLIDTIGVQIYQFQCKVFPVSGSGPPNGPNDFGNFQDARLHFGIALNILTRLCETARTS